MPRLTPAEAARLPNATVDDVLDVMDPDAIKRDPVRAMNYAVELLLAADKAAYRAARYNF